jgi:hypothetical protein
MSNPYLERLERDAAAKAIRGRVFIHGLVLKDMMKAIGIGIGIGLTI